MSESTSTTRSRVEGFIVAERRPHTGDPHFIFGDDWSEWHATRDEADAAAASWRRSSQGTDPSNVGVFALVRVDEPHIPLVEMQAMAFHDHELPVIDREHGEARYHGWVADLPVEEAGTVSVTTPIDWTALGLPAPKASA